jgi:glycosyltransferase involved in cell wall biosynthesis
MEMIYFLCDGVHAKTGGIFSYVLSFSKFFKDKVPLQDLLLLATDIEKNSKIHDFIDVFCPNDNSFFLTKRWRVWCYLFKNLNNGDKVVLHGVWSLHIIFLLIVKTVFRLKKLDLIIIPHGMLNGELSLKKIFFFKIFVARLNKYVETWIALNPSEKQYLQKLKLHKVEIIYPGINTMNFSTPDRNPGVPHNYFLYIAQIHPRKNWHATVMAWKRFKQSSNSSAKFVIAGFGEPDEMFKFKKLIHEDDSIDFIGEIWEPDKYHVIKNARWGVLFSHSEGLPTTLLEMLNLDVPVLCSEYCNLEKFPKISDAAKYVNVKTDENSILKLFILADLMSEEERSYILSTQQNAILPLCDWNYFLKRLKG